MSPLEKIAKAMELLRKTATTAPDAERLGAAFMRAAERPGTFERGRSFADGVAGLEQQFGVARAPVPEMYKELYTQALRQQGGDEPRFFVQTRQGRQAVQDSFPSDSEQAWLDAGLPDKPIHTFESLDMLPGSGEGQRVYPAAYAMMAQGDPEALNLSAGLSPVNRTRRSYLQASALMRDPEMASRILVDPGQLEGVHPAGRMPMGQRGAAHPETLQQFHAQSPTGQVGALQAMAAYRTLQGLSAGAAADPLAAVLGNPMDKEALNALISAVQARKDHTLPFGVRSAKRLGLAMGTLADENAPVPEWLTRGMEYAGGGSVWR